MDLHIELKRHHLGEDVHVTIECQRERRRCQGRNLDGDFDAVDTARVRQAARTPMLPMRSGGDCMAHALHLCMVVWLCKFWPHFPEKYDRSVNPVEFLHIYSTSILTPGGDEAIMANYFPVALSSTTWSWLMNLPEGSLTSWVKMCRQFTANFESIYACLSNEVDLHIVQQCSGESLQSFIQWFSQV
jgi:hypothetical protein